jgi:hypothetical protein
MSVSHIPRREMDVLEGLPSADASQNYWLEASAYPAPPRLTV